MRRRRRGQVEAPDPAVVAGMIRGTGRTLADVEAFCSAAREAGTAGSAFMFAVIDPESKPAEGPLRELGVWPRSSSGPAAPAEAGSVTAETDDEA